MGEARGRRGRATSEAFDRFCKSEYARLIGTVTFVVGDREVATEAVNEALARAWNRVQRGHDLESIAGWVRTVACNLAYNEFRRRRVETKHLPQLIRLGRVAVDPEASGIALDVRNAVAALPRRQREVAVLRFMYDLPIDEIAQALRISQGTVKSSLRTARAALCASLQVHPEEVLAHDVA